MGWFIIIIITRRRRWPFLLRYGAKHTTPPSICNVPTSKAGSFHFVSLPISYSPYKNPKPLNKPTLFERPARHHALGRKSKKKTKRTLQASFKGTIYARWGFFRGGAAIWVIGGRRGKRRKGNRLEIECWHVAAAVQGRHRVCKVRDKKKPPRPVDEEEKYT